MDVDPKYLGSSEMWYWIRMEKIEWTDRVKNKEVKHRVKGRGNILHAIKQERCKNFLL
jgi:hypothetical protein